MQTNTAPTGPFRGPGRAEATAGLERAMDVLAAELDIDPVELRRCNLLRPEDFPHQSPCGPLYDATDHAANLDAALSLAEVGRWRLEQERRLAGTLTADEIGRIGMREPDDHWSAHERSLLQAADELAAEHSVGDATWADLAARHDDGELVEIVTTVGHYTMLAMIANSAGVPPEPWWATLGEAP